MTERLNWWREYVFSKLLYEQENIWVKAGLGFESKVSEGWETLDLIGEEALKENENRWLCVLKQSEKDISKNLSW